MKTLITGSRLLTDRPSLTTIIDSAPFRPLITEVFCCGSEGVDTIGALWAFNLRLPVRYFRPDWRNGKPAAYIALREAASFADAAIVIDHGGCPRCEHLIRYARGLHPPLVLFYHAPRAMDSTTRLGVSPDSLASLVASPACPPSPPDGSSPSSAPVADSLTSAQTATSTSESPSPTVSD